jgi:hypothetical protein
VGLPQFFVPSARSAEEAEQQYVWLQQLDNSVKPNPRVFRVWFRYNHGPLSRKWAKRLLAGRNLVAGVCDF